MHPKVADVYARGDCVFEAVYSKDECDAIRHLLTEAWRRSGKPSMGGRFGFVIDEYKKRHALSRA